MSLRRRYVFDYPDMHDEDILQMPALKPFSISSNESTAGY